MLGTISDFSVSELSLLAELPRYESLRQLARTKKVSVAKLSRLVSDFEARLGCEVLTRNNLGIALTAAGKEVFRRVQDAVTLIDGIEAIRVSENVAHFQNFLNLAGRGFLNITLAGTLAKAVGEWNPHYGIRFIDTSTEETVACALANNLDLSLSLGELDLGKQWTGEAVGELSWCVYARAGHPVFSATETPEQILTRYQFVHQAYWSGQMVVTGRPQTVLSDVKPSVGHAAQTAMTAISLLLHTDMIASLPNVLAHEYTLRGELRPVESLSSPVASPVFLQTHEKISSLLQKKLVADLRSFFKSMKNLE